MTESRILGAREMRGVLLPVGRRFLLLPNSAVAEVIGYREPEIDGPAPEWWLGWIEWRGLRVPVVSYGQVVGDQEEPSSSQRARIAILNTLNGNKSLPYIGIYTLGISRLARIAADTLAEDDSEDSQSPLILESIVVNEFPAWIPDMDKLEEMVLEVV
jgi:chemosensory pili system protein ChpC